MPTKKPKLTEKMANFARAYVELGSAAEAYRKCYDVKKANAACVKREGWLVLKRPQVQERIEELRKKAMKRHDITVDTLIAELEEARGVAKSTEKAAAMVSATMGKAKLLGLDKQIVELTGKDGAAIAISEIGSDQLKDELRKLGYGRESGQLGSRVHDSD